MDEALEDFRKWDDCLLVFKEGTKVKGEIKSIHHDSKSITVYLQKRESGTTLLMSHAPNAGNRLFYFETLYAFLQFALLASPYAI